MAITDTLAPPQPASVRERHLGWALGVISLAQLMLVLDELIVNTALPHIQQALHFSGTSLEWVVTAYAITFGGLLLFGGRSGDILGRRRVFMAGVAVFTLGSLCGGLSGNSGWLIASRALQGLGAAFAAPAALSLIAVTFPEGKHRTRALGVYAAMTGMGGAIGLLAGGLLTTYASWRWVFFVNVPVGIALILGALAVIPESVRHPRQWDVPGALLATTGLAALVYGLTHGATGPNGVSHWTEPITLACLSFAGVALASFVMIEARQRQPLLPLWLFRNRNRVGVYLMLLCLASVFFAMFFFVTLYTQTVWGYSALKGGLAWLPFVGAFIVFAGINTKLVPKVGARVPITTGAVLAPIALFWLSHLDPTSNYFTAMCLPLMLFAAGAGFIFVPLTMTVVAGISDDNAGVASSMFNAGQQIGGALGLATIGSVTWTVVNNKARSLAATIPAGADPATSHRATYAAAMTSGIHTAMLMSTGAAITALIVALIAIRVRRADLPDSASM
jgi:EmrB/QacA subfamily drug resistance transporter